MNAFSVFALFRSGGGAGNPATLKPCAFAGEGIVPHQSANQIKYRLVFIFILMCNLSLFGLPASAQTPTINNVNCPNVSSCDILQVPSTLLPIFAGGKLTVTVPQTYSQNFTVNASLTNEIITTVDPITFNGQFSNASGEIGNLTFTSQFSGNPYFAIFNGLGYTGTTKLINSTSLALIAGEVASDISINDTSRFVFSNISDLTYSRNISGNGELYFGGNRSVTLTGNNAGFTGYFEVNGTVTLIGNTTSLQGAITNKAAVSFDQATAGTYAGVMTGTGSLSKTGVGTLTLTGVNTYAGGTNFNGGTLNVGSSGALGLNGTLSFSGGTLQYSASNQVDYSTRFSNSANQLYSVDTNGQNVTFASALTSSGGSLTKLGAGALTLSGANSYSGGTTVTAGSLIGDTTSLQGAMVNNAAVTFNQATTGTYAGAMSGTGSFTKLGAGALTLTGANSYSGGTNLNAGTLAVGNNSALGSGGLTFTDGATLQASTNNLSLSNAITLAGTNNIDPNTHSLTLAGSLSGGSASNNINMSGNGLLTMTGGNSYSGTNSYTASDKKLVNGIGSASSALNYTGAIPNYYLPIITSTTAYGKLALVSAAAPTAGSFSFDIAGGSTLASATYSNVITGYTLSDLSTQSGTYGSYLWNLVSAGSGVWNLVVASTSTNITNPLVDVTATTNTTTNTNTAANLSGAVTVNVANGSAAYLLNRKMNIVSSTGLSGTFSGVTTSQNLSFLTPYLSYDANNVYLSYSLTPFSTVAKNINQRNVGNALTIAALGPVSSLGAPILNALFSGNYENAQAVMDTVSGSGLAGVQSTAMQVGEMASSSVSDQIAFWRSGETMDATGRTSQEGNNPRNFLAYAPTETKVPKKGPINLKGPAGSLTAAVAPRTFRAWGSMFGGGANYLSDAGRGAAASNIGYYGGLIGVDYQVQPNILVGVALGGSSSNFNVGSLSTNGNLTGFHAGVYGAYTMGNSYIALNETFSAYSNQTNRKAGGYALMPYEQLSAQFGSTEFRTRGELGHGVLMGGLKATPFVAAEIAAYQSNAFSEQSSIYASTFALKNNGQGINSLPTFVGLRLSNAVTLSNGWRLAPVGSVAYVHEFFPQRQFNNMLISMPGTDFNVAGPRSTYNLVQTKVGAQLNLNEKLALFTDFQGEFSSVSQSYGGKGGVKYVW